MILTSSHEVAIIALREEALRMAREADSAYGDGRTTEADAFLAPFTNGEDLLSRLESTFEKFWSWGDDGPATAFNLRGKVGRDECRGLRRWIEGRL